MRLPGRRRQARVEMLPLIDVVFLIMVFLIYAMLAMAVYKGMPVELPSSGSIAPSPVESIALTIQKDGAIWLDKLPVSPGKLHHDITRMIHTKGKEPAVQIFADAMLPYQKLFNVLDILKKAGIKKISLQAKDGS